MILKTPYSNVIASQESKQLNLVIVGQGAIGLLYYSFFHENHNTNVSLISSKAASSNVKNVAVKSHTPTFEKVFKINHATSQNITNADAIIICVKSYQVAQAIEEISSRLTNNCSIILCHNGMGAYDNIAMSIKTKLCFFAMLTTHGCKKEFFPANDKKDACGSDEQGYVINHTGLGQTSIGVLSKSDSPHQGSETINRIKSFFNENLSNCIWCDDIVNKQWEKLAINCVINPLTALNNIKNGDILKSIYRDDITQTVNELVLVAATQKIELSADPLQKTVLAVAKSTEKNSSSMLCDILEGRKTEVDYINGFIHQLGEKFQIETPVNTRLWRQVLALTSKQ